MKSKGSKEPVLLPKITDDQMRALEEFVRCSPDANEFGKKAVLYVLRKSENLTKPVCLTLPDGAEGRDWVDGCEADQMQNAVHDMRSANGHTHIDLLFYAMGTDFSLSHHGGGYVNNVFSCEIFGRTIWFSPYCYDDNAEKLKTTIDEIDAIDLSKDFYYLNLNS